MSGEYFPRFQRVKYLFTRIRPVFIPHKSGAAVTTFLQSRGLRPVTDLGGQREHGDRLRYLSGCRCFHCRRANSDYERERKAARLAGDWNGIVSAKRARTHLNRLRKAGVGRRAVRMSTDISDTVLQAIVTGRKKNIRARTERLIIGVTKAAALDGAYVSAGRTWQQVNELITEGFTKARISREIGQGGRALQLGKKRVTVRNAAAVGCLWKKYMTPAGV